MVEYTKTAAHRNWAIKQIIKDIDGENDATMEIESMEFKEKSETYLKNGKGPRVADYTFKVTFS